MMKQLVINSENPPVIEGIQWQVLKDQSVSQPIAIDAVVEIGNTSQYKTYWRLYGIECGGGLTNTGEAIIITNMFGEQLKPFRIPKHGSLSCGDHALFIGEVLVEIHVSHHRGDFFIKITSYSIGNMSGLVSKTILWKLNNNTNKDETIQCIPSTLKYYTEAIKSALTKATMYHCRSPCYIKI